ncbi:macro domain-containing protein, partial [Streptococcus oralis]
GGDQEEEALLTSCYLESLQLAASIPVKSLAFPLISAGVYGYPKDQALSVAKNTIQGFLATYPKDLDVFLVLYP